MVKKLWALILAMGCVLLMAGCEQQEELQQGDNKMQYFFSGKVVESYQEYLLLEVFDSGNSELAEGTVVEVATDVVSADCCPEFAADEFARVVMADNAGDEPDEPDGSDERLEALAIYKTDETGMTILD